MNKNVNINHNLHIIIIPHLYFSQQFSSLASSSANIFSSSLLAPVLSSIALCPFHSCIHLAATNHWSLACLTCIFHSGLETVRIFRNRSSLSSETFEFLGVFCACFLWFWGIRSAKVEPWIYLFLNICSCFVCWTLHTLFSQDTIRLVLISFFLNLFPSSCHLKNIWPLFVHPNFPNRSCQKRFSLFLPHHIDQFCRNPSKVFPSFQISSLSLPVCIFPLHSSSEFFPVFHCLLPWPFWNHEPRITPSQQFHPIIHQKTLQPTFILHPE